MKYNSLGLHSTTPYLTASGNEKLLVLQGLFHDVKNDGIEMQIQERIDAMHCVSTNPTNKNAGKP